MWRGNQARKTDVPILRGLKRQASGVLQIGAIALGTGADIGKAALGTPRSVAAAVKKKAQSKAQSMIEKRLDNLYISKFKPALTVDRRMPWVAHTAVHDLADFFWSKCAPLARASTFACCAYNVVAHPHTLPPRPPRRAFRRRMPEATWHGIQRLSHVAICTDTNVHHRSKLNVPDPGALFACVSVCVRVCAWTA